MVLAATAPVLSSGAAGTLGVPAHAKVQRSTFEPFIGTTFRLSDGWRTIAVVLRRITDLPGSEPAHREHQFSLLFTSTAGRKLTQETRRLSHPHLDTVSLFVVPVGRRSGSQDYQAIINRTA